MTRQEWAAEALRRAAEHVEQAAKGQRHDELKRRACSVAPYVRDGAIDAGAVTSRLVEAAGRTGKGADEAQRVVAWALEHAADGEAWYPDTDDRTDASITWGGRRLRLPRRPRKDRPTLELVGEDYEPTPIEPRVEDLDLSGVPLATCEAAPPDACVLGVTLYPPMKGGTQGDRQSWTWAQLVRELADPHLDATDKAREVPMWAPHMVEGDQRRRGAVPDVHTALILDYDDDDGWGVAAAARMWHDVRHVVHTSWSHNVPKGDAPARGRGRVVVALSRPVTPDEHRILAEWVLQAPDRGAPGAAELRSVIRAYVAPCVAPGGYEHAAHDPGRVVDVDAMLRAVQAVRDELVDDLEQHAPDPDVWGMLDVRRNRDGEVVSVYDHHRNCVCILRHDRRQRGRLDYEQFSEQLRYDGEPVDDVTVLRIMEWLGEVYGVHASKTAAADAVRQVGHESTTHALQDYLRGLVWDGEHRLQHLLWRYMGCTDTEDGLSRVYARRWAVSAVARALDPGCKVDTMLILRGQQGRRKSSGFRALAGEDWFSDSPIPIGTDDAGQALQGVWIQELPELDSMRRKEVTAIKAFIATQVDHFRRRFDRFWTDRPRQSVLVGTTNEESFLADPTGSRRFWVRVVVRDVDLEGLRRDRDQLWAEAVHLYERGEQWWLTDAEDAQRTADNESYQVEYPWQADLLERGPLAGWFELKDLLADILDQRPGDVRMRDLQSAGRVLSAHGYQKRKSSLAGRRAWRWHAP